MRISDWSSDVCSSDLADLGADVIKIEPPRGDPVRQWGVQSGGSSLWWSMHGRNKRSVAIDLKAVGAREIILELVAHCDVVVENFRPGQLDRMGLGSDVLRSVRPDLIRSEEHTSELQSLMRLSSAVLCLNKQKPIRRQQHKLHNVYQ